jgi:ABC-type transport system involved in cytochrome c biogenesis permease subunit
MNAELISLSNVFLLIAFVIYIIAGVITVVYLLSRRPAQEGKADSQTGAKVGFYLTIGGFLLHVAYYITRWMGQGHAPLSNMFEYMTFLAMMTILGYIVIYAIYKNVKLGVFVLALAITLMGYASVFDSTPQPLIPALQSHWLKLHVSFVALSQGLFAVAFAAGLMYIIRTVSQKGWNKQTISLELFLLTVFMLIGFILTSSIFKGVGYEAKFEYINQNNVLQEITYTLPAIAKPYEGTSLTPDRMQGIFQTPSWMKGVDAPRKFNTLVWSILSGIILYGLFFLIARKRIGALLQPLLQDIKPPILDEIQYRAIAIAFPIFTLGGLIFAMIWAEQAWGRFWGWDPKEVWALITWLFYSAYLHLRLRKGWHGARSAWLSVIGFIIIMFNLVFVNLVIAGLHSYASGG